jgi:hypothetical protein
VRIHRGALAQCIGVHYSMRLLYAAFGCHDSSISVRLHTSTLSIQINPYRKGREASHNRFTNQVHSQPACHRETKLLRLTQIRMALPDEELQFSNAFTYFVGIVVVLSSIREALKTVQICYVLAGRTRRAIWRWATTPKSPTKYYSDDDSVSST